MLLKMKTENLTIGNMSKESNSGGIVVFGLLGIAFVVLKLTGTITLSWWWVTLPFWGSIALLITFIIIAVIITTFFD